MPDRHGAAASASTQTSGCQRKPVNGPTAPVARNLYAINLRASFGTPRAFAPAAQAETPTRAGLSAGPSCGSAQGSSDNRRRTRGAPRSAPDRPDRARRRGRPSRAPRPLDKRVLDPTSSQVVLERRPHLRSCAVEEHSSICLCEIEGVTNLVRAQAFEVAKRQHRALRRRKPFDRSTDDFQGLRGEESVLRNTCPADRWHGPVSREALVGSEETVRRDARLIVCKRGKRCAACLANTARLRGVGNDAEKPRLERRAALEAVNSFEDAKPCFLDDLFGNSAARHVHPGNPQHPCAIHAHQCRERSLVTSAQAV